MLGMGRRNKTTSFFGCMYMYLLHFPAFYKKASCIIILYNFNMLLRWMDMCDYII